MRTGLIVAAVLAVASPALAGTTTFTDSDFNPSTYSATVYTAIPGFTTTVGSTTGVGGVGTALATHYDKEGASSPAPRIQILYDTGASLFVYDPSVQGAITSIDASMDQLRAVYRNANPIGLSTLALQLRVLAQQDGNLYEAGFNTTSFASFNAFVASSVTGIVQSDFTLFDPANPFAPRTLVNPDFAGSAITFGFELFHNGVLVNGGPSTGNIVSDFNVDNFRLTLHTVDGAGAVPEPATWALMIGGFGLAGTALRRRQAAIV